MVEGVRLIAEERYRQEGRGYDAIHDERHTKGELLQAAEVNLAVALAQKFPEAAAAAAPMKDPPIGWPWSDEEWRAIWSNTFVENLAKAGALIAAELDKT